MSPSGAAPPAGWYPDPAGSGGQRYFDGAAWTPYSVPWPGQSYPPSWSSGHAGTPWGPFAWKGARLGRPASGPGSLASPGRRLGARLLDGVILGVVFAGLAAAALALVVPHTGPMFPTSSSDPNSPAPFPGIFWIEFTMIGVGLVTGVVMVVYEGISTVRYGRTLGKAWLHIRPLRTDGSKLSTGRAFARIALYWASGFLSYLGLLDPLWCLWDDERQCLHDKAVDTIVVND